MRWLLGLGLLGILVVRAGPRELLDAIRTLSPGLLVGAFIAYVGALAGSALRLQQLLRAQGYRVPLKRLAQLQFIGMFFNRLLPTSVTGDMVRGGYLHRDGVPGPQVVAGLAVERLVGLSALIFVGLVGVTASPGRVPAVGRTYGVLAVALSGVGMALLSHQPTARLAASLHRLGLRGAAAAVERGGAALRLYRTSRSAVLAAAAVSLSFHMFVCGLLWFVAHGLDIELSLGECFAILPLYLLLGQVPLTPGGVGVRESVLVHWLASLGVPAERALLLSLVWLIMTLGTGLVGGVVFLAIRTPATRLRAG